MTKTSKKYRWNKKVFARNMAAMLAVIGVYSWVLWLIAEEPMW